MLPADRVGVGEALFADDPKKTSCIAVGDTLVGKAGAGVGVGGRAGRVGVGDNVIGEA